jgi:hypothetical protein
MIKHGARKSEFNIHVCYNIFKEPASENEGRITLYVELKCSHDLSFRTAAFIPVSRNT